MTLQPMRAKPIIGVMLLALMLSAAWRAAHANVGGVQPLSKPQEAAPLNPVSQSQVISAKTGVSNAAPAISTSVLAEGSLKYVARFDCAQSFGQLEAYPLLANGKFARTPLWEAGARLQARGEAGRQIISNDGMRGLAFRWASLSPAYRSQMSTTSRNKLSDRHAEIALNYIRGDQSLEAATGLRPRGSHLLGPVVNSTPWVQQRPMANWGESVSGYGRFYQVHKFRQKVLWVGANDGMLHAFHGDTGEELLAYVPGALAQRLAEIPLQRSGVTKLHGVDFVSGMEALPSGDIWPYVDGNPYTADVKLGAEWRTYVFGTLGRGGRGIFALDATDIAALKESHASRIFKWQFTAADDEDLGYQTGDVKLHPNSNQATPIARLNNGKFAVILGNGQHSLSGKAVLYILYVDGPSGGSWSGRYQKIVVDSSSGNGLATPRWEDLDGNGTADVVYAGDLKGNVWKFDLHSSRDSDWGLASSQGAAKPLFEAHSAQGAALPITTAPELVYMARGGLLVVVASGNAFTQEGPKSSTLRYSVVGVWDRATERTALLRRRYTRLPGGEVVAVVTDTMDWSKYRGWAIDLPAEGEAVLTDPSYDAGVLSFVSTQPRHGRSDCNTAPRFALYMVDPIAGMPQRPTQGHVQVNGRQQLVAGRDIGDAKVRIVSNLLPAPRVACKEGEAGCACSSADCSKEAPLCGPGQRALSVLGPRDDATICYNMAPRLQWREIPGLRTYPD